MKSFNKKHLLINYNNFQTITPLLQGAIGVFAVTGGWLAELQYKAMLFFFRKKLKIYSKIFCRVSLCVYNTKKSIGIRMGKGKGSSHQLYKNIIPGQMLFEIKFGKSKELSNEKIKWVQKIVFLLNQKSPIKLNTYIK